MSRWKINAIGEDTLIANSIARLEAVLNTVPEQFQALQDEVRISGLTRSSTTMPLSKS